MADLDEQRVQRLRDRAERAGLHLVYVRDVGFRITELRDRPDFGRVIAERMTIDEAEEVVDVEGG